MSDNKELKPKANKSTQKVEKAENGEKSKPQGENTKGYTVKKGDTRPIIAEKLGLHVETLTRINPSVKDWANLEVGTKLNIIP